MFPNFLVIGASRSGTTWIDKNLRDHPSVYLPPIKELHFFDSRYDRGIEFYESFFDGWRGEPAVGEVTPDYLHGQFSPYDIPRLIHQHLPDVKLIASLRNPVDRLYSEFWNVKARDPRNAPLSFEEKLAQRPEFIREGFYFEHLQRFLEYFPRERMLILLYDDLVADPHAFMQRIYTFLGVDPEFRSDFEPVRVNRATGKRRLARSRALWLGCRVLSRLRFHRAAEALHRINSVSIPEMNPDTRARLIELYRPHNERLEKFLGRDLSHWSALDRQAASSSLPAQESREARC